MLRILLVALAGACWRRGRAKIAYRGAERDPPRRCGDGCYTLGDGTVIPMGDLGIGPTAYNLEP